jgi:uncharacterized protein (DUF58 family)
MSRRSQLRLTPAGTGLAVAAVVLSVVAIGTGYREFVVLAATIGIVLLLALAIPRVTSEIAFRRTDVPRFVARGSIIGVSLEATAKRSAPPTRVIDQLAGFQVPINLPQIEPDRPTIVHYRIHALRRGVHQIGPLLEERGDPFGLVTRTVRHDVTDEILVHPHIHRLRLPESGSQMRQTRAVVPRFTADPMADFRSLREYVVGDDARLVHWASTAKTGALMVRDHFELRRTTRCVVLDTLDRSLTEAMFEDAVEIAASIVCESIEQDVSVMVRTRDKNAPGRPGLIAHRHEALDLFTRVERTTADATLRPAQLRLTSDPGDQIFLVAGASSPLIQQLSANALLAQRLFVIRLNDGSSRARRISKRCVDVTSAEQFAGQWRTGLVSR